MVQNNNLYQWMQEVSEAKSNIRLLNVYQGVPISYPASILKVGESTVTVKTDKYQIVCLYHESETFIQGSDLPYVLGCKVLEIDPTNLVAVLSELKQAESNIGDRRQVRVVPKDPIEGIIQAPDTDILRGELADISWDGLGIYIDRDYYSPRVYRRGAEMTVFFNLPHAAEAPYRRSEVQEDDPMNRFSRESLRMATIKEIGETSPHLTTKYSFRGSHHYEVKVQGVIANSRKEAGTNRYRIGIHLSSSDLSKGGLQQFISLRQSEIIREIKTLYDLLFTAEEDANRPLIKLNDQQPSAG